MRPLIRWRNPQLGCKKLSKEADYNTKTSQRWKIAKQAAIIAGEKHPILFGVCQKACGKYNKHVGKGPQV